MSILPLLQRTASLARLSSDHASALENAFVCKRYPDGHVIARQGERGGDIHLVVEGQVEIARVHEGERRVLTVMSVGDVFGLVSLVDKEPRSATCTARGPVEIASLSEGAASLLFRARAPIAFAFQQAIAAQLARDFRRLDAQLRELHGAASG